MQMNKAILRNSKIVIFDQKTNFVAARVSFFFQPAGLETDFFSCWPQHTDFIKKTDSSTDFLL